MSNMACLLTLWNISVSGDQIPCPYLPSCIGRNINKKDCSFCRQPQQWDPAEVLETCRKCIPLGAGENMDLVMGSRLQDIPKEEVRSLLQILGLCTPNFICNLREVGTISVGSMLPHLYYLLVILVLKEHEFVTEPDLQLTLRHIWGSMGTRRANSHRDALGSNRHRLYDELVTALLTGEILALKCDWPFYVLINHRPQRNISEEQRIQELTAMERPGQQFSTTLRNLNRKSKI